MGEVDAPRTVDRIGFDVSGWDSAVPHPFCAQQHALRGGVLDGPCATTVTAAGQQVFFGPIVIDVVHLGAAVLMIAGAEADKDLVAPGPDTVIGRPSAKATRLTIDEHVLDGLIRTAPQQCSPRRPSG